MSTATDARRAELDRRLLEYHGHGLTDVLDTLDYLRDEGNTMIAGGSLSIGLGNSLSDVDMVLVSPSTKTSAVPLQHWVGALRVDAWTRSAENVNDLFAEAQAALASPAPLLRVFGNTEQEQQLKLLHRIAFGVLVEGPPITLSGGLDPKAIARDLLTREYAERLRESACIAQLSLAAGRELAAAVSARLAVEEALHAALHARGVPFSGDKWLQEQLLGHDDLAQVHARFAQLPPASAGDATLTAYVNGAVAAASALTGLDLTEARLTAGLRWTTLPLELLPLADAHVLAAPAIGAGWALDDAEAASWTALAATINNGAIAHPSRSPDQASLCVRLFEQGVLTPRWEHGVPLTELTIDQAEVSR